MRKRIMAAGCMVAMSIALMACSKSVSDVRSSIENESDDSVKVYKADEQKNEQEESSTTATATTEKATSEEKKTKKEEEVFQIGDTWEVEGQWKFKINSVKETDERSEYSQKEPKAVYIIDYTYENLGYEREYMDGLRITIDYDAQIIDANKVMGYEYSIYTLGLDYPEEVPVGASTTAQQCIGVNNAGDFTLRMNITDGNGTKHTAVFECPVK